MSNLRSLLVLVFQVGCRLSRRSAAWFRRQRYQAARGQGLVEYALILVLVATVVIGILTMVGTQTSQVFEQVNCSLGGGKQHRDNGNGNSNRCK